MAATGSSLADLVASVPRFGTAQRKVPIGAEDKAALMARFGQRVAELTADVDDRDGIKLTFADGWVLVRPSGTEPIIRVQTEAADDRAAATLADRYAALLVA